MIPFLRESSESSKLQVFFWWAVEGKTLFFWVKNTYVVIHNKIISTVKINELVYTASKCI